MPELDPRYASPGLRWGLLLEDHPGAEHKFTLKPGSELDIPEQYGGDGLFCVATITFPQRDGEAQRAPVLGWKPVKDRGNADEWNVTCTKTLGRALKRAGYPDHMPDLKALVVWRERNAEVSAITAGSLQPMAALPAGRPSPEETFDAAGAPEVETVGVDDAPDGGGGDPGDDPTMRPPDESTLTELRQALGALGKRQKDVTAWANERRLKVTKPQTEHEARLLRDHARSLLNGEAPSDDDVAEPCVACSEDPCVCAPEDAQQEAVPA